MCGQQRRHAIATQRPASGARQYGGVWARTLSTRPGASRGGRVLAQWGTARCAPCPWTRDVRPGATGDVLPTAPAQRCNAPAGLDGDPPSRPSAPSGPRGLIRRCEKRVERSGRQTGHGPAVRARTRHRHDALDEAALARHTQCRVMKKRVQRRTADMAAARAGAALVLQSIQKRPAHRRIESAQRQRRRRCPPPLLGKVPPPAAGARSLATVWGLACCWRRRRAVQQVAPTGGKERFVGRTAAACAPALGVGCPQRGTRGWC